MNGFRAGRTPFAAPPAGARHIALFVRSFDGGGGAERVMLNLAHGFAAEGRRVDLVMGRVRGRFIDELAGPFRVVDLRVPSAVALLATLPRLPFDDARALLPLLVNPDAPMVLGAVPRLADYLRDERPDVLLCALNYPNIAGVIASELSGRGPPVVLTVHNHLSAAVARGRRPRLRRLPPLVRRFFPRAAAIVAVSEGVARDATRMIGTDAPQVGHIYNPVIDHRLDAMATARSGHRWLDEGRAPVVLGVGKLKPQKDFATLLRAVAKVREHRPVRLVILGEGPEAGALKGLAAELGIAAQVDLPGFVDNPYAYMARAGVFVLSSAWEGFANVVAEALACGCPVVSTDCPSGPAEILAGGRYGRLVPVGDAAAMATAIAATLDDPGDRAARQVRARAFAVETAVRRYLALFDGLRRAEAAE